MNGEKNKTFKGMLKILINDYQKQNGEKMYPIVQELVKAQRELQEVKGKLKELQSRDEASSSDDLQMTTQYQPISGISSDRSIRLRVLSEDGLETLFFIDKEIHRTLESYNDCLKPRMILNIEDTDDEEDKEEEDKSSRGKCFQRSKSTTSSERTYSFDASDV
ncbi:hypothetical protein I4U23_029526 [Adineta vaga]|nr:hypothetical protein I4U23_029526 [Adineta vaga]